MTSPEVTRRRLMRLAMSAGVTALGGSMLFRATAARAAGGEVVAAVFPGSWEDAFQNVVAPALMDRSDGRSSFFRRRWRPISSAR